jgi:hypothetical protein
MKTAILIFMGSSLDAKDPDLGWEMPSTDILAQA